jgi:hypothetical protein
MLKTPPGYAWHFVGATLRDGRPVPADGEMLVHTGPLDLCASGLHASVSPFDALRYAPGETLCLVRVAGEVLYDTDKLVCSERTIIASMNATDMLRYFARMQAVSVAHFWDMPDVVLDYLMTGNEALRAAAWAAARDAARDAAGDAAWAAAGAAAWAVAWAAARDAARDAAWAAARDAARDAAGDAAWAAAGAAARAAAWAAAGAAAGAAAWAAAGADFNALVFECFEQPLVNLV